MNSRVASSMWISNGWRSFFSQRDRVQAPDKPQILTSPIFASALAVLLLNDFLLKPVFHNWITGKLSDFAGVFVFSLFFAALFPHWKRSVYLFTILGFGFWKSPYSEAW